MYPSLILDFNKVGNLPIEPARMLENGNGFSLIVRRLGDKGANVSSFIENLVRIHLEEYGEEIEKWRKL